MYWVHFIYVSARIHVLGPFDLRFCMNTCIGPIWYTFPHEYMYWAHLIYVSARIHVLCPFDLRFRTNTRIGPIWFTFPHEYTYWAHLIYVSAWIHVLGPFHIRFCTNTCIGPIWFTFLHEYMYWAHLIYVSARIHVLGPFDLRFRTNTCIVPIWFTFLHELAVKAQTLIFWQLLWMTFQRVFWSSPLDSLHISSPVAQNFGIQRTSLNGHTFVNILSDNLGLNLYSFHTSVALGVWSMRNNFDIKYATISVLPCLSPGHFQQPNIANTCHGKECVWWW